MSCDFCDEYKGIRTIYNKVYGSFDREVYSTTHFTVFPCMGQLREGHLLIVAKRHINCIGMLLEEELKELDNIASEIKRFYMKRYGLYTLSFEHGVLCDDGSQGGCGIYHMHLHLLPVSVTEYKEILNCLQREKQNTVLSISSFKDIGKYVKQGKTYVFVSGYRDQLNEESYIILNERNYFESQYMRKITAFVLKREIWNWKIVNNIEHELLETARSAKNYFKLANNNLDKKVANNGDI